MSTVGRPRVAGLAAAADDRGTGPAVVLLHGWPVTTEHWRHLVPALVAAGFRAVTIELAGLGGADLGDGRYAKTELATGVRRLVDALGIGRFVVIGHDWGGTVGYLLAADVPDRVTALVMEEEVPPGVTVTMEEPGRSSYPDWHAPLLRAPGVAERLLPAREDALVRAFLEQSAGPAGLDAPTVERYVAAYARPGALAATTGYYRTARTDAAAVRERVGRPLTVPVLTVGGAFGMGRAVADGLRQLATDVTHVQVAGAGHYPVEQDAHQTLQAVVDWLAR